MKILINKEIIIKHICQRIIDEHRKHRDLDWEEIAARKIYSMISDEFVPKSETDVIKSVLPKRKYVKQELRFERLRNNLCQECGSADQKAGTISFTCLDCGHTEMCI